MHMDDDIMLDIQILKNLINDYSLLPEKSCFAPYLCEYSSQEKNNLLRRLKDTILFLEKVKNLVRLEFHHFLYHIKDLKKLNIPK